MKFVIAFLALLFMSGVAVSQGQTTDERVTAVLGDAESYREVFSSLQAGVRKGDRQAVAALLRFPLNVRINDKRRTIVNERAFLQVYDQIVTPNVSAAIDQERWESVTVSSKGIMIGGGAAWINGICRDSMCRMFDARVVALQDPAATRRESARKKP